MRGFTMLEILLALAIIGLLAGVLIGGSAALLNQKPVAVEDVFWSAVQQARKGALSHEREVLLRFFNDRERGKGFEVIDGVETKTFPLHARVATNDLVVDFLGTQKGGPTVLIAGVLLETTKLPHVRFYSDGTCESFRLQIAGATGSHVLSIDPWTCAPILTPPDPNAPRT